jgi:hypothetical protein
VQFNLDIQRELISGLAWEVGYVGSQSRKLTTLIDVNPFDPTTLSSTPHRVLNKIPGNNDGSFSFTPSFENAVNANYNALQTKLTKGAIATPYLGTTYFTLAYTWAHSIDNSSGFRNRNSQIPFFDRNLFRGPSDFDLRQQLTFSGGWDLPFDHAWVHGPKRLTKGWSLFPIMSWHTGFPLDVSANLSTFSFRPGPSGAGDSNLVFATLTGPITYFNPHTPTPGPNGNQYFAPDFVKPNKTLITGSYGSGRGILRGPGRTNLDMALAKTTAITERIGLQFRFEAFNVFNHAEFLEPDTNISNAGTTFGNVTSTYSPRVLQLAAKITF